MTTEVDRPSNDDVKIFVGDESGPEQYTGFFEDDGETGYLYVSDRQNSRIVQHLQVYTNSAELSVEEKDVQVVWTSDGSKCGVLIWGAMRGIIDVTKGIEGRAFLETRDSLPISDKDWLKGFESVLN